MEIVLHSFGAKLRIVNGLFKLEVPDLSGEHSLIKKMEYAPKDVETILLHPHTSVSTDALLLAFENGTDVLILDKTGQPQGRLWPNRPTATLDIQKAQLAFSGTVQGLAFARQWLVRKLYYKNVLLGKLMNYRQGEKRRIIMECRKKISELTIKLAAASLTPVKEAAATLRGIEGTACRHFFETLNKLIPKEYIFDGRSRRPAKDMFNAFLNYGYGILYRQVEKALIQSGLNPYIGFMHRDDYIRKSLVFDFIEPYRHWVEQVVFSLFTAKEPSHQHLEEKGDGYYLNWEGRKLLSVAYLEKFNRKRELKSTKPEYYTDSSKPGITNSNTVSSAASIYQVPSKEHPIDNYPSANTSEKEETTRTYSWRQKLFDDAKTFSLILKNDESGKQNLPSRFPYG